MAFEGSDLQNLSWQEVLDLQKPKAHDEIDSLIDFNDSQVANEFIMDLVMGSVGGGGANISKTLKNILTRIKARNARSIRNLNKMQGTGQQSMSSSDRAFLNKEIEEFKKLIK